MTILWPDGLPCPVWSDYGVAFGDGRLAKAVDAGPPSYRRRYSRVPKVISASIHCNPDQYCLFDNFYEDTLKAGTLPFWMKDRLRDGQPLLLTDGSAMLGTDGVPILITAFDLCLFGSNPPQVKGAPGLRLVSFSLSKMPI